MMKWVKMISIVLRLLPYIIVILAFSRVIFLIVDKSYEHGRKIERAEWIMPSVKTLPSSVKFGKSGKVNHIKQRIEDIEYKIAVKEAELSYRRKFARK